MNLAAERCGVNEDHAAKIALFTTKARTDTKNIECHVVNAATDVVTSSRFFFQ